MISCFFYFLYWIVSPFFLYTTLSQSDLTSLISSSFYSLVSQFYDQAIQFQSSFECYLAMACQGILFKFLLFSNIFSDLSFKFYLAAQILFLNFYLSSQAVAFKFQGSLFIALYFCCRAAAFALVFYFCSQSLSSNFYFTSQTLSLIFFLTAYTLFESKLFLLTRCFNQKYDRLGVYTMLSIKIMYKRGKTQVLIWVAFLKNKKQDKGTAFRQRKLFQTSLVAGDTFTSYAVSGSILNSGPYFIQSNVYIKIDRSGYCILYEF